ncbi:MAG: HD domain-containing protein [Clostridia bacterium]|nr:HD domain-containing protein [Clostridia bacterium]
MDKIITLEEVKNNKNIQVLIDTANSVLEAMGYTEHGLRHVGYVSKVSSDILKTLNYDERTVELAAIAGWVHDVGNAINRNFHGLNGASMLYPILNDIGFPIEETAIILAAVGNHEADTGIPVSPISAALIIADKSDAHRTRVRRKNFNPNDIHDKVNYSIKENKVSVNADERIIEYRLRMDASSSVMEFMEIFMPRMVMCQKAAELLKCRFDIVINDSLINNHT